MIANKPSVYLDTSVINFLFADDAPQLRDLTAQFFDQSIAVGVYDVCISQYVTAEIGKTMDGLKKAQLLQVIADYDLRLIQDESPEIPALAQQYVDVGIVPQKKTDDALHVAFCTVRKLDYLASWNFKHLANVNRERRFLMLNQTLGYLHQFRIVTPEMLISDGI